MKPYLGITGVVTAGDVDIIRECREIAPVSHDMMAGVLVSGKTLRGQIVTNRRYPTIGQAVQRIKALSLIPNVFPTLHYNTGGNQDPLHSQLRDLLEVFEDFQGGVQLNVVKPSLGGIKLTRERFPDVKTILQVNGSSVRAKTPEAVEEYVGTYAGHIDYALIDFSGGKGHTASPTLWYEILHRLGPMAQAHNFGLVVAGGLGPEGGETIKAVRCQGPLAPFGADAETKVRVEVDNPLYGEKYQDRLDRELSMAYVRSVGAALE